MEKTIYLSKETLENLQAQLEQLEKVELPRTIEELNAARGHGDLSENFEFTAAREEVKRINAKIGELRAVLTFAKSVNEVATDMVGIGTCFTATLIKNGVSTTKNYQLLGYAEYNKVIEAIIDSSKPIPVTIDSPFGKAVSSKKISEGFEYIDPDRNRVAGVILSIIPNLENEKVSEKTLVR